METQRYIIQGHVQGVGFRNFVLERANKLGVTGWVKNLANGDVECLASAGENVLKEFEAQLWKGPSLAKVTHIERVGVVVTEKHNGFVIVH